MSTRYWEVKTAKEFGKTPLEFWNLPEDDQAYMLALVMTDNQIAAVEGAEAEKELEKAKKKGKK